MDAVASHAKPGATAPHLHSLLRVPGNDHAGVIPSRDPGQRRFETAGHILYIAWIDGRRFDLDERFSLARLRIGNLSDDENGWRTIRAELQCFHVVSYFSSHQTISSVTNESDPD